jgi:hypothetical protein
MKSRIYLALGEAPADGAGLLGAEVDRTDAGKRMEGGVRHVFVSVMV